MQGMNSSPPAPEIPPFAVDPSMRFIYCGWKTYEELVHPYDPHFAAQVKGIRPEQLNKPVYLFEVFFKTICQDSSQQKEVVMKMWKGWEQIKAFLSQIAQEIGECEKLFGHTKEIQQKRSSLSQGWAGENSIRDLIALLQLISRNPYLRKTEEFLLFIDHCISIDKWSMKIYKQIKIYRKADYGDKFKGFMGFGSSQKKIPDFFLTITSDGILRSDNHLLESRITHMVPFTNKLSVELKISDQNQIAFKLEGSNISSIRFHDDYVGAINLIVALNMAVAESSYPTHGHRFMSYGLVRENCASKLYIDGVDYFRDLYECLIRAKWQVCITGWMITPYFLLKRPGPITDKTYRLDGVLESIAKRGVKVFIIVFMEPKLVVNNDSEHVQQYLESLSDNIKVYRHPNNAIPLLWSHHEKMVVIDQETGFMGGLDICYGRMDNAQHLLNDPGKVWDGADYNNFRQTDIYKPREYQSTMINTSFNSRMPWHDIAVQLKGDVVLDMLRHFVQYWYFVKAQLLMDPFKYMNMLRKRLDMKFYQNPSGPNQVIPESEKQAIKFSLKKFDTVKAQFADLGQKFMYMVNGREEKLPELFIHFNPGKKIGNQTIQMCRSASEWSIGLKPGEHQSSIHQAYVQLIKNSKKFIYIENQFFMGKENKIVESLADRIILAHKFGQKDFKVIIVMPLLPGFEGDISQPSSVVLRVQVHNQYQAILRDFNKSLFAKLKEVGMSPKQIANYIYFFGLRTCDWVDNQNKTNRSLMTEIIYVHSKLMIVDDTRAIIGSANINDRSLLGCRDSELICVIEEQQGNILDLRARLFNEHFGLNKQQTLRFQETKIWEEIISNAINATSFYREFFGCIPDDTVTQVSQIGQLNGKACHGSVGKDDKFITDKFNRWRSNLRGHAVEFPLKFLQQEDLSIQLGQKEYFAPEGFL